MPDRLSPSALARYRVCPRSFYFQYVLRSQRRERPSPVLAQGNAVHDALDRFIGLPTEDRRTETLHDCLRSVWRNHAPRGLFRTRAEEIECGLGALRLLTRFAENWDLFVNPLSREQWVSVRLDTGMELYGKVDRIDPVPQTVAASSGATELIDVIDYKTGRVVPDDHELRDEPAIQLYAVACEATYRRNVRAVRLIYLAEGVERAWYPEREDIEWARGQLEGLSATIQADSIFEPFPGSQCRRCPFAHLCPDAGRISLDDLVVPADLGF